MLRVLTGKGNALVVACSVTMLSTVGTIHLCTWSNRTFVTYARYVKQRKGALSGFHKAEFNHTHAHTSQQRTNRSYCDVCNLCD